jgi:uncharacterized Tic20 family protein
LQQIAYRGIILRALLLQLERRLGTYPPKTFFYPPSQDEKTFGLLAHVLGIFAGFIAPLVIFLIKRNSKFVSFHALQALAWHVIYLILVFSGIMIAFISIFASIGFSAANHSKPPLAFIGIFGIVWLLAMGGAITNMILGIVYGIKAHNGEWATIPLIGRWVLNKVIAG